MGSSVYSVNKEAFLHSLKTGSVDYAIDRHQRTMHSLQSRVHHDHKEHFMTQLQESAFGVSSSHHRKQKNRGRVYTLINAYYSALKKEVFDEMGQVSRETN